MQTLKLIIFGLLFFVSLSLIFTKPGVGSFENFYNYKLKIQKSSDSRKTVKAFILYPPSTFLVLNSILIHFPPEKAISLFSNQKAFLVFKISLFIPFIFTWLALLYLAKPSISVSIAYFASAGLMLPTLALGYFTIFALPFFLLSLAFAFKKEFSFSGIFYLLSLSFNWSLLIISPVLLLLYLRSKRQKFSFRVIPFLCFLMVPLLLVFIYIFTYDKSWQPLFFRILSKTFSVPWLVNEFSLTFFKTLIASKILNIFSHFSLLLFFLIYANLFSYFKKLKQVSDTNLVNLCFLIYLAFVFFFPGVSEGNLIWLVLISLVQYSLETSKENRLKLVIINILVFINLYIFFGLSGIPPVRGAYFSFFQYIFFIVLAAFTIWYFKLSYKFNFLPNNYKHFTIWVKRFLIVILALFNFSLITAQGSPDTVSWTQYSLAAIKYPNPFRAYTDVILQYPPLSMVIFSFFANTWNTLLGLNKDYAVATKISIFVFYILTVVTLSRLKVGGKVISRLNSTDKLLIILTTFSLIIQTQGLADVNIYVVPSLIAAITFLFKRSYFWSGFLFGVTVSIKWQPLILIPVFLATILNLKYGLKRAWTNLSKFILAFFIIPLVAWVLVLKEPYGLFTIKRAFAFFFEGAAALSGQALNLNWIVTYFVHIFQPEKDSLSHLGGLNRQIATSDAPIIFQGYLFYLAVFVVLLIYWILQKKNFVNFVSISIMIFFSHHILNKSAYEKHLFYTVLFMLVLYLLRPTKTNRLFLILFDIMTVMNLAFFYGFTGPKDINRLFFGFDMTVAFAVYYTLIYLWVFWKYIRSKGFLFSKGLT